MKKSMKLIPIIMMGILFAGVQACKKKESTPPSTPVVATGNFDIRFNYVFGPDMKPWQLGQTFVHSKTGDTLNFTMFRYYVSNIKLKKADGTWWVQPNSYYLLEANSVQASTIEMKSIPAGEYIAMEYTMGVDSEKNVTGAHDGALAASNGMYWDWNSGYIMLKAEGTSPNSPNGGFRLHMGGYLGADNVITVNSTDFSGNKLKIASSAKPVVKLQANVARLWHTSPGVATLNVIHAPGAAAVKMAKDFYSGIIFNSIG